MDELIIYIYFCDNFENIFCIKYLRWFCYFFFYINEFWEGRKRRERERKKGKKEGGKEMKEEIN